MSNLTSDEDLEEDSPQLALYDAIEAHSDDIEESGSPVGPVVETMLESETIGLADVGKTLRDSYFTGRIYQPSATTVTRLEPDGGVSALQDPEPVDELEDSDLLDQYREIAEEVFSEDQPASEFPDNAFDRANELWSEIRSRTEAEEPKCPECGSRRWSQAPGDPAVCRGCGREARADTEQEVHNAWDSMMQEVRG